MVAVLGPNCFDKRPLARHGLHVAPAVCCKKLPQSRRLEGKLECELQFAGRVCGTSDGTEGCGADDAAGSREDYGVCRIEGFRTELQGGLSWQPEVLEDREVEIPVAIGSQGIAPEGAEGVAGRGGEGGRIDPLIGRPMGRIRVADQIRLHFRIAGVGDISSDGDAIGRT